MKVLGHVALSYCPMIDRSRSVRATRLTVVPARAGASVDAVALLEALAECWPDEQRGLSLNIQSDQLLGDILAAQPGSKLMIEVPPSIAEDAAHSQALKGMHANGNLLMLRDRPEHALAPDLLPCFKAAIVHLSRDRRLHEATSGAVGAPAETFDRRIGFIQDGITTVAQMEASFQRGAQAVLGWPMEDAVAAAGRTRPQSDFATIIELIRGVDAEEPIDKLENLMRRDPSLAFQMLRYINSPAFGLRVEITSFRHAIMILGYRRLKRWLALLLATASKDANMRPVMYASVRRGVLMENLVQGSSDEEMRNELFICGVFSMLDRIFHQPFEKLLERIPVPERVMNALVEQTGPYRPYLQMVDAIESGQHQRIVDLAENALLSLAEVNQSILRALGQAAELESGPV